MMLTTERLIELRAEARLERDTQLEHLGRLGEDPLDSLESMPSVDEFVVTALRDELLEERGQLAEFSMARLAARSRGADAATHARNADRAEFDILREIAERVPELTVAVWSCADRLDVDAA